MAAPTEADVQSQIGKVCKLFEEMRKFGHVNSPNLLQMEGDLVVALEGDFSSETLQAWQTSRASYASAMDQASAVLTPLLRTYAQFMDVPEREPQSILDRLFERFTDESLTVESRAFSFGTITAGGSNVGNGTLNRLTTDENGDDIEAQASDAKTVTCVSDEHSGASEHEERFNIRGGTALRDRIKIAGSGFSAELVALSARHSERFAVQNPSFDNFVGSVGSVTSFPGWTVGSAIGNFDANTSYYRNPWGSNHTPYSLKIAGNDSLTQNFNVRQVQFNPNIPVYVQVAYNRETGSGDGTLKLKIGDQESEVTLAAQTGWNILRVEIGTKNWFSNWNVEDAGIAITLADRTSGYVLVDDLIVAPMTRFDGAWYALVGGSTPFLRDDEFTWTDTETGSIIQYWLWRAFGRYLPHSGSPSWSDPTTIDPTPTPTPSPTPTPTP